MIKELAFTPHIFDEQSNHNDTGWNEQIRILGERLFSWHGINPFVVANLGDGGWEHNAGTYVNAIKSNTKTLAQALITKMKPILVKRSLLGEWPEDDESAWVQEALNVSRSGQMPLDRIVATHNIAGTHAGVNALSDVTGSGFWSKLSFDASTPMSITDQVDRLKTLCFHAGYISISSAYFRNGIGCDTDFIKCLIEMLCSMRSDDDPLFMDIHCQASSGSITEKSPDVQGLITELRDIIATRGIYVRLIYWTKIRERIMLAGDKTTVSGQTQMKVRWGITMQHIARLSDNNTDDYTYWNLLATKDILIWQDKFYNQRPVLGPIHVTVA